MERQVIIVGGGIAGLAAAIYLGRAQRDTLVIDSKKSLARWAPDVENYLGFPQGISGRALLHRGRKQALQYGVEFVEDHIQAAHKGKKHFMLLGRTHSYQAEYVILATGLQHLPPEIKGVGECTGLSVFFCKDCDGHRVKGKRIGVYGSNDDAVEYALAMRIYSPHVSIVTNGKPLKWSRVNSTLVKRHRIPLHTKPIVCGTHQRGMLDQLNFEDGRKLSLDALFTTRGDVYHNHLAKALNARVRNGEIDVDEKMRTSVKGLFAAGCVTPANCQMLVAAGQGAVAAQAINREIFISDVYSSRNF